MFTLLQITCSTQHTFSRPSQWSRNLKERRYENHSLVSSALYNLLANTLDSSSKCWGCWHLCVSFFTAVLWLYCTLYSKYETVIEIERERGRDKDLDISRIEEWFYIIKQIEVITAACAQSMNCAHSASLWCQRLQTVNDDLITVS